MDDLIYRRAAIDDLFELYEYQAAFDPTEAADLVRQGVLLAEKRIERLPCAQSEYEEVTPRNISDHLKRAGLYEPVDWFSRLQFLNEMGYVICRKENR